MTLPSLTAAAASVAERYLSLLRVRPQATYRNDAKFNRDFEVIDFERHGPKCARGESWIYFAFTENANPVAAKPGERLYVGAQTQDRMFRGDDMDGDNFHHAQMRAGNGNDTLVALLMQGVRIAVFRARSEHVAEAITARTELNRLRILAQQPRTSRRHLGWWYEQYILHSEPGQWRWNTATASRDVSRLFAS